MENEEGLIPAKPTKTSGKGSEIQPALEEREEEDTGDLTRKSSQPTSCKSTARLTGIAPLEVPPLHQVPLVPPSFSKFSSVPWGLVLP